MSLSDYALVFAPILIPLTALFGIAVAFMIGIYYWAVLFGMIPSVYLLARRIKHGQWRGVKR